MGSVHSRRPVLRKHPECAGSFAFPSAADSSVTKLVAPNILTAVYAAAQAR